MRRCVNRLGDRKPIFIPSHSGQPQVGAIAAVSGWLFLFFCFMSFCVSVLEMTAIFIANTREPASELLAYINSRPFADCADAEMAVIRTHTQHTAQQRQIAVRVHATATHSGMELVFVFGGMFIQNVHYILLLCFCIFYSNASQALVIMQTRSRALRIAQANELCNPIRWWKAKAMWQYKVRNLFTLNSWSCSTHSHFVFCVCASAYVVVAFATEQMVVILHRTCPDCVLWWLLHFDLIRVVYRPSLSGALFISVVGPEIHRWWITQYSFGTLSGGCVSGTDTTQSPAHAFGASIHSTSFV